MKRSVLSLALGAVLCLHVVSRGLAASDPSSQPASKPVKLLLVHTLHGADAIREFEHNVQVMQNERQAAMDLKTAVDREKDAKKKKDLQAQLDAQMKKLNDDNALMTKTYGFSLTRNYSTDILLNIYLQVSDEEATRIEQQQKQAQKSNK